MSRKINITQDLDFVGLDTAIERLVELRKRHGGSATIDITMERKPYASNDHIEVNLLVEERVHPLVQKFNDKMLKQAER